MNSEMVGGEVLNEWAFKWTFQCLLIVIYPSTVRSLRCCKFQLLVCSLANFATPCNTYIKNQHIMFLHGNADIWQISHEPPPWATIMGLDAPGDSAGAWVRSGQLDGGKLLASPRGRSDSRSPSGACALHMGRECYAMSRHGDVKSTFVGSKVVIPTGANDDGSVNPVPQ